jgi:hypothetical protein
MIDGPSSSSVALSMADRIGAKQRQSQGYADLAARGELTFQSAVEIATTRMADVCRFDVNGVGTSALEGMIYVDQYLRVDYVRSDLPVLVRKAKSDYKAYRALQLVVQLTPDHLKEPCLKDWQRELYLGMFVPPKRPRGQQEFVNLHRNVLIVGEVEALTAVGFTATRSKVGSGKSACDVIVAALAATRAALSYDAVETIWRQRKSLPKLEYVRSLLLQAIGTSK